jgi:uncharacterized damage-inducible protein DinB
MNAGNSTIMELMRHHAWANAQLIDHCAALDPAILDASAPGTYGEVHRTIAHFVDGERWYISMLQGMPRPEGINVNPLPSLSDLSRYAAENGQALVELASILNGSELVRMQEDVIDVSFPAGQLLTQIVNHATEHRTHVTTVLSQHGIQHPSLSGWAYVATQCDPRDAHIFRVLDR